MIDEKTGSRVLAARFTAAGLSLKDDYPFAAAGRTIHLDGYDPERKIGFEYLTTEAGDREEITPEVVADLELRMGRGELFVLLIDEREVEDEATLIHAADHFLSVLEARGLLPQGRAS